MYIKLRELSRLKIGRFLYTFRLYGEEEGYRAVSRALGVIEIV